MSQSPIAGQLQSQDVEIMLLISKSLSLSSAPKVDGLWCHRLSLGALNKPWVPDIFQVFPFNTPVLDELSKVRCLASLRSPLVISRDSLLARSNMQLRFRMFPYSNSQGHTQSLWWEFWFSYLSKSHPNLLSLLTLRMITFSRLHRWPGFPSSCPNDHACHLFQKGFIMWCGLIPLKIDNIFPEFSSKAALVEVAYIIIFISLFQCYDWTFLLKIVHVRT